MKWPSKRTLIGVKKSIHTSTRLSKVRNIVILQCVTFNELLITDRYEDALREAREIDKQIESKIKSIEAMERETPLLGLPLTVKESIMVKIISVQASK